MATKSNPPYKFNRLHFLLCFWAAAGVLFGLKCAFPEIAGEKLEEVKERIVEMRTARPVVHDSITLAKMHVDSMLQRPRPMLRLTHPDRTPVKNRVTSIPGTFHQFFPDLNDVQ